MRRHIIFGLLTSLITLVCVASAAAKPPPAPNGQILFGNPDGVITTVNPNGSHPNGLIRADCGFWSPSGSLISTCGAPDPGAATQLIDPITGTVSTELSPPDPTLFLACGVWSPNGARLACEQFQPTADPSRIGLYSVRASDGGDIQRITSNPGGQDNIGDYSPDGSQIVFARMDPSRPPRANNALFVVNVDGTGLRRITPWGLPGDPGSWSPNGDWILFGGARTGKVFLVHSDGADLHTIPLAGLTSRSFAFQPSWSPDGTKFVFGLFTPVGTPSSGPSSNFQEGIYTANAAGSDVDPVNIAPPGTCCNDGPNWGTHALAGHSALLLGASSIGAGAWPTGLFPGDADEERVGQRKAASRDLLCLSRVTSSRGDLLSAGSATELAGSASQPPSAETCSRNSRGVVRVRQLWVAPALHS